ncbi:DUF6221 family protein [Streptomyces lavendulae]|uniref:DUF6221 family protein n=1 Tax=Streptomyces lavendulae TaxID=1914 RepID=UPI0031E8274C
MTDALVQFLRARLNDDEQIARGHQQWSAGWDQDNMAKEIRDDVNAGTVAFVPRLGDRTHIARHDPARVLAEVEAKGAVIGLYELAIEYRQDAAARAYRDVLRLLSVAYADHPDFAKDWAPDPANPV